VGSDGRQADLMDSPAEPQTRSGETAVVVIGVAGSGKSTVADLCAQQLGWIALKVMIFTLRRMWPRWRPERP
jgi:adenylylsulfate kinase-like enzyme